MRTCHVSMRFDWKKNYRVNYKRCDDYFHFSDKNCFAIVDCCIYNGCTLRTYIMFFYHWLFTYRLCTLCTYIMFFYHWLLYIYIMYIMYIHHVLLSLTIVHIHYVHNVHSSCFAIIDCCIYNVYSLHIVHIVGTVRGRLILCG